MVIPILAFLVMIIGALLYALEPTTKMAEMGRLMFVVGLLVVLAAAGGKQIKLF